MSQASSLLDQEPVFSNLKVAVEEGKTNATIAREFSTSEKSIRRFRKRHELQVPGVEKAKTTVKGDNAEGVTAPSSTPVILDDPDAMLRERGLDPAEWYIDSITVNEWDGPQAGGNKVTYHQAKFTAKRLVPVTIVPPRTDGWSPPKYRERRPYEVDGRRTIVIVGDQQAPFHDPKLHELFCQWLEFNEPDEGVSLGDLYDFPNISRHPTDPENDASVNECLQGGYDIMRGYVDSSPMTMWKKLIGNHDERIRQVLLKQADTRPLYGIKRPDTPTEIGEPVLELAHLSRLDELGVEVVWPNGGYQLGQIILSDKLAVRHGWLAKSGSGSSALATLKALGYSIIVGHTHRQAIVSETKHEITGAIQTLMGVEAGCMCRISQEVDAQGRKWPSYTTAPDWQNGFVTVDVWEDGSFNIDSAKYVNGKLLYRDQCYV